MFYFKSKTGDIILLFRKEKNTSSVKYLDLYTSIRYLLGIPIHKF